MPNGSLTDIDGIPPIKSSNVMGRLVSRWRGWQLRRAEQKEAVRRRTPEARFKQLLDTAEQIAEINPQGLSDFIRAVLRPLQSDHLLGVAEFGRFHGGNLHWGGFFGAAVSSRMYTPNGLHFRGIELDSHDYPLSLARDPVLPWPWNHDRYVSAIATIGITKRLAHQSGLRRWQEAWRQDSNHGVMLWLPWSIGFVTGGNHSIATGILAGEGHIIPDNVYDMSFLLDEIRCDGHFYRSVQTDEPLSPMQDPRIGAVFEIGRLLLTHGVRPGRSHSASETD